MAPALASGAIALNTSAIYAGQAVGAATGGWLIGQGQMGVLHWVGLAGLLMSWWVSQAATRSLGLRSLKT
jgi:predicted MFS family arabinose efflux permease